MKKENLEKIIISGRRDYIGIGQFFSTVISIEHFVISLHVSIHFRVWV